MKREMRGDESEEMKEGFVRMVVFVPDQAFDRMVCGCGGGVIILRFTLLGEG